MNRLRSRQEGLLLLATALAVASPALADELKTRSGETLLGTIVEERPAEIVFDSVTFGRLTVHRDLLLSLTRTPAPAPAADASAPASLATKAEKAEQAEKAEAAAAAEERQAELSTDTVGRFLARINPLKGWKTNLNLGFVARRGDDSDNDLTIRFRSNRKTDSGDEHTLEARYYYAEDVFLDNQTTATDDLLTGFYNYRHPLTEAWFFQSRSQYYRDAIKQLDHEVTQTFGIGLNATGERWRLTLTPAAGVQWKQVAGVESTGWVAGLYQQFKLDVTRTLSLGQSLDYLFDIDDPSDYSNRIAVELAQKLGAAWSLALRYDYTYDAVVGKDSSENQERFALTIGLEF